QNKLSNPNTKEKIMTTLTTKNPQEAKQTAASENPQDAKLSAFGKIITDYLGVGIDPRYALQVSQDQTVRFEMGASAVFSMGPRESYVLTVWMLTNSLWGLADLISRTTEMSASISMPLKPLSTSAGQLKRQRWMSPISH